MKKDFIKTLKGIKKEGQSGFSLIEILIALSLMAIAGTFVMGKIFDQLHEGKVSSTKIQMNNLADRLKEFRRHCGQYPTTEQTLEALVTKPSGGKECARYAPNGYLDAVPKDPWDNDFYYESDGKTFNVISYGNDGAEGGEGEDADISFNDNKAGGGAKKSEESASEEAAPANDGGGAEEAPPAE